MILLTSLKNQTKTNNDMTDLIDKIKNLEINSQISQDTAESTQNAPAAATNETLEPIQPEPTLIQPTDNINNNTDNPSVLQTKTVELLKENIQNPENVINPLELAEILFEIGRPENALVFYKLALEQIPQDTEDTTNKPWIILQVANCARKSDIPLAITSYQKIIKLYPDSPWREYAKTQEELLQWKQDQNPDKFISKNSQASK